MNFQKEGIDYIFFCAVIVLTFFCGLHQSQSLDMGCNPLNYRFQTVTPICIGYSIRIYNFVEIG